MPFDPVYRSFEHHRPEHDLDRAIASLGIQAIPSELLQRHKLEQLGRHPPGWIHAHQVAIRFTQSLALAIGLLGFAMLRAVGAPSLAFATMVGMVAVVLVPMLVRSQGPASWRERLDRDLVNVHPELRHVALNIRRVLPDVAFYVGELRQDRVLLDPYLIAECRGQRAILGIWDGEALIAKATGGTAEGRA